MIDLGNKIRKLRRERGLTQEQFASAISISPQAVSKWEMGNGYPDMSMIPTLANFFDVSLDELFDFDISRKKEKIEQILSDASAYFWDDFERAERIYLDGIKEFPSSEKLKCELLSLYECHIRTYNREELFERAEELAKGLINELTETFAVCSAKSELASLYLLRNKYDDAKAVVESLPYMYPYMLNDRMRTAAYMLRGEERLAGAKAWKVIETQELFIACAQEAEGYYETGDYKSALSSFTEAVDVVERFMIKGKIGYCAYEIGGTDTNHMCYYLGIAGCELKLGNTEECAVALEHAKSIVLTSARDRYEQHRPKFLGTFNECYCKYGLDAYAPFEEFYNACELCEIVSAAKLENRKTI